MSKIREQHAYQRGIKAARLWRRLKGTILRWDQYCVTNARKHKLPGWIGHIPMGMLAVIMLVALVFGGIVIASVTIIIMALLLIILSILEPRDEIKENTTFEYKIYGDLGSGWYSGKTKISDGDTSPYDYRN
jgi:Flp pilus assembly protein TadB